LLWLTGLALVALALLLTDRLLCTPGLTEDSVRRLRQGMTLEQVEELLGGPRSGVRAEGLGAGCWETCTPGSEEGKWGDPSANSTQGPARGLEGHCLPLVASVFVYVQMFIRRTNEHLGRCGY
jgi:hypothetical protein